LHQRQRLPEPLPAQQALPVGEQVAAVLLRLGRHGQLAPLPFLLLLGVRGSRHEDEPVHQVGPADGQLRRDLRARVVAHQVGLAEAEALHDVRHHRRVVADRGRLGRRVARPVAGGVGRHHGPVGAHLLQQRLVHPPGAGRQVEADERPVARLGVDGGPHVDLPVRAVQVGPPHRAPFSCSSASTYEDASRSERSRTISQSPSVLVHRCSSAPPSLVSRKCRVSNVPAGTVMLSSPSSVAVMLAISSAYGPVAPFGRGEDRNPPLSGCGPPASRSYVGTIQASQQTACGTKNGGGPWSGTRCDTLPSSLSSISPSSASGPNTNQPSPRNSPPTRWLTNERSGRKSGAAVCTTSRSMAVSNMRQWARSVRVPSSATVSIHSSRPRTPASSPTYSITPCR